MQATGTGSTVSSARDTGLPQRAAAYRAALRPGAPGTGYATFTDTSSYGRQRQQLGACSKEANRRWQSSRPAGLGS